MQEKLEAKDVLSSRNHMQAADGPKNAVFVPGDLNLWPLTLTFKLVGARDKARLRVNLAQIRSAVPEIFHTQTKTTGWRRQKQNLPQFAACGN